VPTEEQLDVSRLWSGLTATTQWGQKLTIPDRIVSKLSFYLSRTGTPGGTLTFQIRKVSDDSLIVGKLWGNSNDISTTAQWYEVTFGTPTRINDEVYLLAKATLGSAGDIIQIYDAEADVKAGENMVRCISGVYTDYPANDDFGYIYTYELPVVAPTVSTDPATSVEEETATGNGNITDAGGEDCDKRGFVYGTTSQSDPGNVAPAVSGYDSYEEETGSFGTGAFTGSLTSLDPNTTYYVRAHAHNSAGYSYGAEVSFTTQAAIPNVTTNPATEVGQTTATLNGTLDADGGEACDCGFEYGETTGYGSTTATQSKTTGETFSQEVRGLKGGTVYHFRAKATNSLGTDYGADRTFHTEALSAEAHQALGKGYALGRHGL